MSLSAAARTNSIFSSGVTITTSVAVRADLQFVPISALALALGPAIIGRKTVTKSSRKLTLPIKRAWIGYSEDLNPCQFAKMVAGHWVGGHKARSGGLILVHYLTGAVLCSTSVLMEVEDARRGEKPWLGGYAYALVPTVIAAEPGL